MFVGVSQQNCVLSDHEYLLTMVSLINHRIVPVLRFEFERIVVIQSTRYWRVAFESERARDQCQSAAVTSPVNLRFSFLCRVCICTISVGVRKLQVAILAPSPRDMSLTVRIV